MRATLRPSRRSAVARLAAVRAGAGCDKDIRQLEDLRSSGLEFLVVPRETPWVAHYPEFLDQVEQRYRCVARQRYLCTVYDLNESPHVRRDGESEQIGPWRRWFHT